MVSSSISHRPLLVPAICTDLVGVTLCELFGMLRGQIDLLLELLWPLGLGEEGVSASAPGPGDSVPGQAG